MLNFSFCKICRLKYQANKKLSEFIKNLFETFLPFLRSLLSVHEQNIWLKMKDKIKKTSFFLNLFQD